MIIPRTETRAPLSGALASALMASLLAFLPCRRGRWRDRQRGERHGDLDAMARKPRAGDQGRGRKGDLPLWRGAAICRLLTAPGLRHRASGWKSSRDVLVGDTVRWKVEPATSGAAGGQAIHLIVKPSEPGLVTSMVVTTLAAHLSYPAEVARHPVYGACRLRISRGCLGKARRC